MVVTRRRSYAVAEDRSRRSDVMPSAKKKAKSSSSSTSKTVRRVVERKSAPQTGVNIAKQKIVTTESVTHQQTIQKLSPSGRSLADEFEPWELLPKTGYTYAKSPTYSQKYLDQDWEVPNMSRPGLRSRLSTSMALNSSTTSNAMSFSHHTSNSSQQRLLQTESQDSFSSSGWRKSKEIEINEKEQNEETAVHAQRLAPSVTRSGRRRGGSNQISQSSYAMGSRDTGFSSMSVEEYMQLEKDMEYSGQSVPYKESPRLSLFGLDQVDEYDVSDTETDLQTAVHVNSSQSQQISSSYLRSLITTIVTVITSSTTKSWDIVTTPVGWLAQTAEAIFGSIFLSTVSTSTKSQHITCDEYTEKIHAADLKESHTNNSLSGEKLQYTNEHYDNMEQISDLESSDVNDSQNEKYYCKSAYELAEETSGDDDSLCCQFCYVLIAVAYLLFIAFPRGIFKVIKNSAIWLASCILLPVVDGAKSAAVSGYTTVASSLPDTWHASSASTNADVVKDSDITVALADHSNVGWLMTVASYTEKTWSALYTAAQMMVVLLWMLVTALCNILSYGLCCNWCWRVGTWIHEAAAHVLLLDVWIHSRSRETRKSCCCCLLPLLLLLIPFLLMPVSHDWLAAVTKEKSHTSAFISDDIIERAKSSGISYEALREIIAREVSAAKADLKTYSNGMYKDNLAYIQKLEKQLNDQTVLLAQLNDCCKDDAVLAGLISRGVQEQLAMLMYGTGSDGGVDGGSSGGWYDSKSGQLSNSAFVHWLESHFSNSADFDAKIAALTEMLNQRLKEQSEANKAALLAATQAERAAKEATGESEQAAKIAAAVELAQGKQAAMWAKDKASLDTLIAGIAADLKKTDEDAAAASTAAAAANKAAMEALRTAAAVKEMQSSSQSSRNDVKVGTGCVAEPGHYQTVTEDQVKLLIREALGIFGADKTGMVDYALESAGGSVISTRCSETYHKPTAQLSLFGFPLWYVNNSPRTVIQPEVQPGQCWAFKGSQGYIVIQLAGWVRPTSFSLEHIPRKMSLTGKIDSAPKDFTVWGLKYERDTDGQLLGNYTYLDNDEPLQFFQVEKPNVGAFHIVELRIHSNHGNQKYTCLYRFRVHGVLTKT